MKSVFAYSVLQYRHSIALGEALNVGIVFAFPEYKKYHFSYASSLRLKQIYSDLDPVIYNALLSHIDNKIQERSVDLFTEITLKHGLDNFINSEVLRDEAASLHFQKAVTVQNVFKSPDEAIEQFTKLLIPKVRGPKHESSQQKEDNLIKTYTNLVVSNNALFKDKLEKNYEVKTEKLTVKFDVAWQNGKLNLVKAINFDLYSKSIIQSKAIENLGYLTALKSYAQEKNIKFDLLIQPPKTAEFFVPYKDAIKIINDADTEKEIITSDKILEYSQRTAEYLSAHNG